MTYVKIVLQIIGLYVLNWLGSLIQHLLHLPIPGSIIGLFILFLLLLLKVLPEVSLEGGALFLLKILPLLFLPSILGIMREGTFLKQNGLLFVGLILISTFLTLGITGWVTERVSHFIKQKERRQTS